MPLIDATEALDLLEAAVEKFGVSHVYDTGEDLSCVYFRPGVKRQDPDNPGNTRYDNDESQRYCMVGFALHEKGISDDFLITLGWRGVDTLLHYDGQNYYLPGTDLKFTPDAKRVIQAAQAYQDKRGDWGGALSMASREA